MIDREIRVGRQCVALRCALALMTSFTGVPSLLAAEHVIEIKDFAFLPNRLAVAPGDTVTWINRDIAPHTATANNTTWNTNRLKTSEAMSITVTEKMKEEYFCRFHPQMKASLVLQSDQ